MSFGRTILLLPESFLFGDTAPRLTHKTRTALLLLTTSDMKSKLLPVLLAALLSLCSTLLPAQNELPLGQWRAHLPYRTGVWVTQSDQQIIYATEWSLLLLDKAELSTRFISTTDGLSNTGVNLIRYNRDSDILVVVYDNAVIDLVSFENDRITDIFTLNQIRNFQNFTGEKAVFDVFMENDSMAFLAASYGVSLLNLFAREFSFTTLTETAVSNVAVHDGFIYAATEEGVYRVPRNSLIPDDFSNWELLGPADGFPGIYRGKALGIYEDELYLSIDDTLFVQRDGAPQFVHHEPGYSPQYLNGEGTFLLIGYTVCPDGDCDGRVARYDGSGPPVMLPFNCAFRPKYAIEDESGRIWLGDAARDFRALYNLSDGECQRLSFNSPLSAESRELTPYQNQLWLAVGGVNQTFSARFVDEGFGVLEDGLWTHYNRNNTEGMRGEDPSPDATGDDFFDVMTVQVHPDNGHVYAGSFLEGMVVFDGENFTLYNEKNSSLSNAEGDVARTRVVGLAFDESNNLWVANYAAMNGRPISVLTENGDWQNFSACGQTNLAQVDIDENGFKWFVVIGGSAGLVAFDEGLLEDAGDDRCRVFTASNSELPTNSVNCLAADLDGDVWVGTEEGVVIFECGGSAFEPECRGTRRIVEQDGFGAFLLETENVLAIAVDGANRKWVGTRNGVFVLSPDGEEQIARYTVDNSPLFDNTIVDIAVNDESGEVFIGTNKGILSFQSEATLGGVTHRSDITIFPNPVRPDYDGPIAIRGLSRDAIVKITDINGKMVYETEALGGQAVWDGRDYNGRRAQSGVYLVFSATNSRNVGFNAQPTSAVAKILFLN